MIKYFMPSLALAFLFPVFMASNSDAAEYFVNKEGLDTNNGTSREQAFLTIQKGVDTLKAGDTLTIGPGEYVENVFRAGLGNTERDTVIRAEIPGTAVMRGDVPAPEFKKVEGYRFVYAAPFDQAPEAVLEHATMKILEKKPNLTEVEFEPGSLYYDAGTKVLYISSADGQSPDGRRYTIAVNGKSGFQLDGPVRVTIEGICATGFYRTMARRPGAWVADFQWGIVFDGPTSCRVSDCCTFLNCGGIALNKGRGNVIEKCVSHDNIESNIQYYGGANHADNVVRNCYAYRGNCGIDSYLEMAGPMIMQDNISWGHYLDYSNKGSQGSSKYGFVEGCVAFNNIRIKHLMNCIFAGQDNEYGRGVRYTRDDIIFNEEPDLDVDHEFADPINMDFRLQGDSRFIGTREDGKDRGLYPEHDYKVFFLSPEGNDENDGSSMRKAWKTLARALKELSPGDRLYLAEGVYTTAGQTTLGRAGAEKIYIRGRGRDRVVIEGALNLTESAGVEFNRLVFADAATVSKCEAIEFANCTFNTASATNVKGLKVTHALFAGAPLRLEGTAGVYLSGNIYANADAPAVVLEGDNGILYSDYNSYQDAAHCWMVKDEVQALDDLRNIHDRYSEVLKPEIAEADGAPELGNVAIFAGRGSQGTSLGKYQEYDKGIPHLAGPFLHSVSDTTANIEWWTSAPATCEVAWGETPDMEHAVRMTDPFRFGSLSLTGLEPGRKYYFAIRTVEGSTESTMHLPILRPEAPPLTFVTVATPPKPTVYYVATDGNDEDTGLSREHAWRTISHAAGQANAGDTVMVAEGTYRETVRVRASGALGQPIMFRPMPGQKVVLDGEGRSLGQAFILIDKNYIHLDGFYFTNYSDPAITVQYGQNVTVSRCFSDGRGPGYAGPLLSATHCKNFTARDCVSIAGMGDGMYILNSPDALIENNVFLRNLIYGCVLLNEPDDEIVMRKNVFADSLPFKSAVPYFEIAKIESFEESDNCYYMRLPDEERKMFMFYGNDAYDRTAVEYGMQTKFETPPVFADLIRITLSELKKIKGETGSYLGNPWFKGSLGMKEGELVRDRGQDYQLLLSDKLVAKPDLDFPDLFATDPKAVEMGVGLQPDAFEDFWFNKK